MRVRAVIRAATTALLPEAESAPFMTDEGAALHRAAMATNKDSLPSHKRPGNSCSDANIGVWHFLRLFFIALAQ